MPIYQTNSVLLIFIYHFVWSPYLSNRVVMVKWSPFATMWLLLKTDEIYSITSILSQSIEVRVWSLMPPTVTLSLLFFSWSLTINLTQPLLKSGMIDCMLIKIYSHCGIISLVWKQYKMATKLRPIWMLCAYGQGDFLIMVHMCTCYILPVSLSFTISNL